MHRCLSQHIGPQHRPVGQETKRGPHAFISALQSLRSLTSVPKIVAQNTMWSKTQKWGNAFIQKKHEVPL